MNTWQCWRHLLVPVSLPCWRISHLQLVDQNFVPQIDHFVTILPYYRLCKMSKNANTWPIFIILLFKNICIYLKLIFFCTVQIKDSCRVDVEDRRFYLLFLRLIWDLARHWLQQKMLYSVLMHFMVDLAQKWLREKTFYYPLLQFMVDFARAAWLREQTFSFMCLFPIDFARQWLWRQIF